MTTETDKPEQDISIDVKAAVQLLRENDYITILCHASPDGDTLGSAYALCGALQKLSKNVRILCSDEISPRFKYMKKALLSEEKFADENENFVVSVDVADVKLLGDFESKYKEKINLAIDHHISNTGFAENLLLKNRSSCSEIVFEVIDEFGIDIDENISACLYTGIATDTGCFKFSNTNRETHLITAEIMKQSFNMAEINYLLFDLKTKERLELEQKALQNTEYYFGGKCAVISLDEAMLEKVDSEDINGISALARQIEGVELGITLKQKDACTWKVSLRSNSYVNCQELCRAFGGGGHIRAAGCKLKGTLSECRDKLVLEAEKHIH